MGKRDFLYFYVVWRLSKQKLSTYNHTTLCRQLKIFIGFTLIKGQLISKADWRAIDSPKKRMDEFVLFAFCTLQGKQIKKYEQKFARISALYSEGSNLDNF